jgi:hypothetical protein
MITNFNVNTVHLEKLVFLHLLKDNIAADLRESVILILEQHTLL